MIVYRITNSVYKNDLTGNGAALFGGRWNSKGNAILYCTQHVSLAVLELVVNFNRSESPLRQHYHLIEIDIPETNQIIVRLSDLKKDWIHDLHYSQYIGDEFIATNSGLILKVPSAVVPEEHNFLINPVHVDFKKVKINKTSLFRFDDRLIQ